ncbi:adaptor complexes medium subunit family protein [Acanthamoeba castellanii str. Neff]|uniref:Adaptor complexes medium subunit family protein n=1 Tax=Acanthamoeba castellanii (strain ATCC 30010 / Neff) TaxID=1257118 RepID=L8HE52_ACACF|nr:adaptor complexes medium subunit family protein [Acanthamoeba castellanii str. Neff]ELR23507.1 adaptor complexes medium subunit family protein [Acanthamoeba castellanii str. Neff]
MATMRAVWLINVGKDSQPTAILSRRFPTVENRVRLSHTEGGYMPPPPDADFARLFVNALAARTSPTKQVLVITKKAPALSSSSMTSVPSPPSSSSPSPRAPPALLSLDPVVFISRRKADGSELYFVGLPEVNRSLPRLSDTAHSSHSSSSQPSSTPTSTSSASTQQHDQLLELPCVTATLCLLEDIANFASIYEPPYEAKHMAELQMYINCFMPFGTPSDTSRPAWKPYLYKGKPRLEFMIREEVKASQYDSDTVPDAWQVHGTIFCKADIEGLPEITVTLSLPTGAATGKPTARVEDFIVDSRVRATDVTALKKLTFTPPLGQYPLCTYTVTSLPKLPLRGFYQMKEVDATRNEVKVLAQLKLDDAVNNDFEYCEVHVPFPNRGQITSVQASPTAGSVVLDDRKQTLKWDVGQRFASRNLEVALPASVVFDGVSRSTDIFDPFCTGASCYVQAHFKVIDHTLSGINIDPKSVVVNPSTKVQVVVMRETVGNQYFVWNSLGQGRYAVSE